MPPRRQQQQQSGDGNRPYEVTGPTSALTSFLREQGITGNIHRRPQPPAAAPVASSSATTIDEGDENEENEDPTNANAEASTSSSASKAGGKRKNNSAAALAAKKKKARKDAGGDDDEDEMFVNAPAKPGRYDNRIPGSIAMCAECGKKFTVTKYTASNPLGNGVLCLPCSQESINSGGNARAPTGPKAKQVKKRATKAVEEKEYKTVKTLQQICIGVIGKQIDNVEALGDIGPKNLDKISKIVSKHRALTKENLELFLDIGHRSLSLYDCTNIPSEDLAGIANFCPHLERILLNMCGQIDDSVLEHWAPRLKELKYLSLYAPYLITSKAWIKFFSTFSAAEGHVLEGFGIRQSARFNDEALQTLVDICGEHLYNIQLSEIGRLTDDSLKFLYPLKNLTVLDISKAGTPEGTTLTTPGVVALLKEVGANLVELNLDQNYELDDDVLVQGIKPHCGRLRLLSLSHLENISPEAFSTLFDLWPLNSGLQTLNLRRCLSLTGSSLRSLLAHSGHSLLNLNVNSVDEIEQNDLFQLAKEGVMLETLDVSFVRAVDNFVVKAMLDGMPMLKVLFCHGNNRVTDDCPQKRGVSIRGLENSVHMEL
ncbi:RNI-like protein [Meredithblackwellia eburnea MCA 4105]